MKQFSDQQYKKILDLSEQLNDLLSEPLESKNTDKDFWTINIKKGQTIEGTLKECKKLFPVWRWTDDNLDKIVKSDRTSKKAYSIKVKANIEADKEFMNKSADDLKEIGHQGITLLERLQLEVDYFKETGKHLDIQNVTLCTGSRSSDGYVPSVYWRSDYSKVKVYWYFPSYCYGSLRSRKIV